MSLLAADIGCDNSVSQLIILRPDVCTMMYGEGEVSPPEEAGVVVGVVVFDRSEMPTLPSSDTGYWEKI